jgi:hypothetical protein
MKLSCSCKPHAQGYLNVTADHSLVNWYDGTDQSLTQALHSVSQGGWRNKANPYMAAPTYLIDVVWF